MVPRRTTVVVPVPVTVAGVEATESVPRAAEMVTLISLAPPASRLSTSETLRPVRSRGSFSVAW